MLQLDAPTTWVDTEGSKLSYPGVSMFSTNFLVQLGPSHRLHLGPPR
jgi:hypothetical protein